MWEFSLSLPCKLSWEVTLYRFYCFKISFLIHNTISLFTIIGTGMIICKCKSRESDWLFQYISFDILQGNSFSILSAETMGWSDLKKLYIALLNVNLFKAYYNKELSFHHRIIFTAFVIFIVRTFSYIYFIYHSLADDSTAMVKLSGFLSYCLPQEL